MPQNTDLCGADEDQEIILPKKNTPHPQLYGADNISNDNVESIQDLKGGTGQ